MNESSTINMRKNRWRLILGNGAEQFLGNPSNNYWQEIDTTLNYLYEKEFLYNHHQDSGNQVKTGGLDDTNLTVPEWIKNVHTLFPEKAVEQIEEDAIEKFQLEQLVTNPHILQTALPNITLLKAILRYKPQMDVKAIEIAKRIVNEVINKLTIKQTQQFHNSIHGTTAQNKMKQNIKSAKNFDALITIKNNLKYYDNRQKKLFIHKPFFSSKTKNLSEKWKIIILLDQSGSMLDSIIHASISASVLNKLSNLETHLCTFDTNIVDLSNYSINPVETLMKIQLGGGTDISNALNYASSLITNPDRTMIVIISDFYDGSPIQQLISICTYLLESNVTLLGLISFSDNEKYNYNQKIVQMLTQLGMTIRSMKPEDLVDWVIRKTS